MHEFSIATSLVESLFEIARKQSSTKVVEVQLKVGKLRLVSLDQLRFSYEILSKGTLLEGSKLTIEETPAITRCLNCNSAETIDSNDFSFHFGLPKMMCQRCGGELVVEGGDECLITKVRMVIPAKTAASTLAASAS